MAKTVAFDADNKLHNDLLNSFKQELVSQDEYVKEHLFCQYVDYIDELEVVATNIATEELGIDEEFDDNCSFAIQNPNPSNFIVIAGLEFMDFDSDEMTAQFIKLGGQILIEGNKTVILDIDPTMVDYSGSREFLKAKKSYKFK